MTEGSITRRGKKSWRIKYDLPRDETGDAPVFGNIEGNTITPFYITTSWRRAVRSRGLPKITFHSLRHSHASALIAAGVDVVTVSKRLGHASPALTLSTYSHLFTNSDDKAAAAIDAALSK